MQQLSTSSRCSNFHFAPASLQARQEHNQVLGQNQNKHINKYKDMSIVKHENWRIDKYKFWASTSFNSYFRCRPGAAPKPTSRYTHTAARPHCRSFSATATPPLHRLHSAATPPQRSPHAAVCHCCPPAPPRTQKIGSRLLNMTSHIVVDIYSFFRWIDTSLWLSGQDESQTCSESGDMGQLSQGAETLSVSLSLFVILRGTEPVSALKWALLYCCALYIFSLEFCQWRSHTDRLWVLTLDMNMDFQSSAVLLHFGVGPWTGTRRHARD